MLSDVPGENESKNSESVEWGFAENSMREAFPFTRKPDLFS
jgi:hypothetical protein